MDEAFKAKMNTVTSYQGGSEIDVAVERGEIVCRGMAFDFGRPFPGHRGELLIPSQRTEPGLIEEAKKSQMDMEHTPGEELQALMKELMNQPHEVVERVKKILD